MDRGTNSACIRGGYQNITRYEMGDAGYHAVSQSLGGMGIKSSSIWCHVILARPLLVQFLMSQKISSFTFFRDWETHTFLESLEPTGSQN